MSVVAKLFAVVLLSGAVTIGTNISAFADVGHGPAIGKPGTAAQASRTIKIVMKDNLYEPASISVKAGETVRFVVVNAGDFLHEFNLGTAAMHAEHQKHMAMMVEHGMLTATELLDPAEMDHSKMSGMSMEDMTHDDPNSVLVEPGQTAELVWTFDQPVDLEFACNIPGHYEAGMAGPIEFTN